jgi:hypothetical protein
VTPARCTRRLSSIMATCTKSIARMPLAYAAGKEFSGHPAHQLPQVAAATGGRPVCVDRRRSTSGATKSDAAPAASLASV